MARTAQMPAKMRKNVAKPIKTITRSLTDFPPALQRHMASGGRLNAHYSGPDSFWQRGRRNMTPGRLVWAHMRGPALAHLGSYACA
jgi:hypothetical protein